ncbi:hypothetical protein GCM10010994_15590 [Chelatococcus reniformis]|uniref:Uncharacterized protein n=1 Tax=Chelatococcus reniformis TaxID=1494448 RepID=A0A916U1S1_9HYPH|nr:hypothetical protein GCM10010994_15590 [Chelatococcus reniformis]
MQAQDDLDGDEAQQEAADQRDRRRHRQAVGQGEDDDQQGKGLVMQPADNLADADPIIVAGGECDQDVGRALDI